MHFSSRTGMTQVEINACWREALKHENAHRQLNEDFDFNPKNLIAITQKVNTVTKCKADESADNQKTLEQL